VRYTLAIFKRGLCCGKGNLAVGSCQRRGHNKGKNWTVKRYRVCRPLLQALGFDMRFLLPFSISILFSTIAYADYGTGALRLGCDYKTNALEIEPFVAWNDGNSRYPFSADEAINEGFKHIEPSTWFSAYAFKDKDFIYQECNTSNRTVRIYVARAHLTVTEGNRVVVDWKEIGNAWDIDTVLLLRSNSVGSWQICEGLNPKKVSCKEVANEHQ
jgi:hypothetical protein